MQTELSRLCDLNSTLLTLIEDKSKAYEAIALENQKLKEQLKLPGKQTVQNAQSQQQSRNVVKKTGGNKQPNQQQKQRQQAPTNMNKRKPPQKRGKPLNRDQQPPPQYSPA